MKEIFPLKFKKYLEIYPKNYLKNYAFYSNKDRRFRYVRDKVLSKKNYFLIMDSMLIKKNYIKHKEKERLLMNISDLKLLESSKQIIGLHSSSHPTLIDKLDPEEQYKEYKENKSFLEENIVQQIRSMSHPCGRYNKKILEILKDLDIQIGFRSSIFPNSINSNLEIPRDDHTNIINKFNL